MNSVIENYQHLSNITAQMRTAAVHGEWDQLAELEEQCSQHVASMKQQDLAPLDESIRRQKVALIRKILADDAAIRDQTLPWMAQLQRNIQSSRSEQRVKQAYSGEF
jgi:flagellar protein FliT